MIMRFKDVPIICFRDVAIIHFREVPIIRFPDFRVHHHASHCDSFSYCGNNSVSSAVWIFNVKVRRFLWLYPILPLLFSIEPTISLVHRLLNHLKFVHFAANRISLFRNVMRHYLKCLIYDIRYITPNSEMIFIYFIKE